MNTDDAARGEAMKADVDTRHDILTRAISNVRERARQMGLSVEGQESVQWRWRHHPPAYPHGESREAVARWWSECEIAILDALVNQGCIIAWPGDGVGCVTQIVAAVAKAENARGKSND